MGVKEKKYAQGRENACLHDEVERLFEKRGRQSESCSQKSGGPPHTWKWLTDGRLGGAGRGRRELQANENNENHPLSSPEMCTPSLEKSC